MMFSELTCVSAVKVPRWFLICAMRSMATNYLSQELQDAKGGINDFQDTFLLSWHANATLAKPYCLAERLLSCGLWAVI